MFAQYSPLFTSGLLSESNTPSCSRQPSLELRPKNPRESLPVDVTCDSIYSEASASSSEAVDDAVFLTFAPSRRQREGASFLSLDLPESSAYRSMSLRRKDTVTTRATTYMGRSVPTSPVAPPVPYVSTSLRADHELINPCREIPSFSTALKRRSVARRSSRNVLPRAKPAPLSSLPAPPMSPRGHRTRPSDFTLTLSTCLSEGADSLRSPSLHRSTQSEPSVLSPVSPSLSFGDSFWFSPPLSPSSFTLNPLPPTTAVSIGVRSRPSMRSTASFGTRQNNRSAALAALEGRVRTRPRAASNFMSLSDDEDDMDVDADENISPAKHAGLLAVLHEDEDVVIPARKRPSPPASSRKTRSRRGTLESLLSPLTNFIDFRDEEGSTRSWRSFVEIS